jgi:type IV pilus assembly protein PilB
MARKRLGEVLRERGHISSQELSTALDEQRRKVTLLGEVLLQRGGVPKEQLIAALEEVTKVRYVDCASARVDPEVLKLVPRALAVRHCAFPLSLEHQRIIMVMAEPQNLQMIDNLSFASGRNISPRLGFRIEILAAIDKHYGSVAATVPEEHAKDPLPHLKDRPAQPEVEFFFSGHRQGDREVTQEIQVELKNQSTPAVRLVSAAIAAATDKNASDIHIEPQVQGMVIRMRVDGVMRELAQVPDDLQSSVVSRVKILADMDIAERRRPQDGRAIVRVGPKKLDLRISTLPTHLGEKVVIRLLDPNAPRLEFRDLGMTPEGAEVLSHILERPHGMLLVTGPTGSGKTTTLYAALHQLRSPGVNIVTVEDPVEYMLEGVNQVQVNTKAGLTFAKSLRSILRQDPNVIMVGEIRDGETAEIALKAAQTGHLVLTTVHTNDSVAAIARLLDLQIPSFLLASSVTAVMSQRLVRKLCSCREQVSVTPEYAAQLLALGIEEPAQTMYARVGCAECDFTGFRGRIGVFETLIFDELMRSSIRSGSRPDEIRALARASGMKTIQEDAVCKERLGITTLAELRRVIPFEQFTAARCHECRHELAQTFLFCPSCGTKRRANLASIPVAAIPGGDSA